MSVTHLEVTRRTPYASDYERVDGILHFAADPGHPTNARIVDLDKAPLALGRRGADPRARQRAPLRRVSCRARLGGL